MNITQIKLCIVFSLLNILSSMSFAQNGTYLCNSQGFSMDSENKFYSDKMIITIDINDVLGGSISINNVSHDLNFRYDILAKDLSDVDKKERTITKTYKAVMNMNNVQVGGMELIGIIENMDNDNINFWVYHEKSKSYNQYMNLKKIK